MSLTRLVKPPQVQILVGVLFSIFLANLSIYIGTTNMRIEDVYGRILMYLLLSVLLMFLLGARIGVRYFWIGLVFGLGSLLINFFSIKNTLNNYKSEVDQNIRINAEIINVLSVDNTNIKYLVNDKSKGGRFIIQGPRFPIYSPGYICDIAGVLKNSKNMEDFNYIFYLYTKRVLFSFQSKTLECHKSNNVRSLFFSFKDNINQIISKNTVQPYTSFLTGIIWGDNLSFEPSLTELFLLTGTSHIIAASGFNLNFFESAFSKLFSHLSLNIRDLIIVFLLLVYCFLANFSSSITRAYSMILVRKFSYCIGVPIGLNYIILYSVALLLLLRPYLCLDVGLLLSLFATIGLVNLPQYLGSLRENIKSSLSATIATFPISLIFFKQFATMGVVVNSVVLFLIDDLMLLTITACVLSLFVGSWGKYIFIIPESVVGVFLFSLNFVFHLLHSLGFSIIKFDM